MVSRDDNTYPRILNVSYRAVIVAVFCFVCVNIFVGFWYKNSVFPKKTQERLGNPVSYSQIVDKIDSLKKETAPVTAFIGASAMWGSGDVVSAEDTYVELLAKQASSTVLYNFSFPAARPLDIALIALAVAPYVSTTVVDVNEVHLADSYHSARFSDRTTYIRSATLLKAYGADLEKYMPEAVDCLEKFGVPQKKEFFIDFRSFIPLLAHKDSINKDLFGLHYQYKAGEWVAKMFSFGKKENTVVENKEVLLKPLVSEKLSETLNSCLVVAHAEFASKQNNAKNIFILPPHFRKELTAVEQENRLFLRGMLEKTNYLDIDGQNIFVETEFVDSGHLTAVGHKKMADLLWDVVFEK